MSIRTLHMVGNAHIDPVWLWRWHEGFQEALATFRSALDRMEEYPEFVFTSSSAALYEWVQRVEPVMLEEIRRRVAEGRWRIVGGWWIQPDCNIPGGESFVRQGLYGQRAFRRLLGVTATVGYNPDSFGHAATLPQILKKSGMDAYVFMRPDPRETEMPWHLFDWEGPDGSRVRAFRIIGAYGSHRGGLEEHIRAVAGAEQEGVDELMCFYGVGNHGGGPTKENLDSILALRGEEGLPDLAFGAPDAYFESVRGAELPVWRDELQHHASGCYAAHSGIKRWNREAENALLSAEVFSTIAERVTGLPYPADFERAWKNVLFNQFHDIMAGTSLRSAYEDARDMHGEAMSIADRARNDALQSIAWNIGLPFAGDGGQHLVVFNPHAWPVRASVQYDRDVWRDAEGARNTCFRVTDSDGNGIPSQALPPEGVTEFRTRQAFMADLPPLGHRVYTVRPGAQTGGPTDLEAGDTFLDNRFLRLELDPATGEVARLIHKASGADLTPGGLGRGVVISDPSDTWSHGVRRFEDEAGRFAATDVRLIARGPVLATLRVRSAYGDSTLTQDYTLFAGVPSVRVDVTVDWREHFKMLKIRFPTALADATATYEVPYGFIERPTDGEEKPMQAWMDLTGNLPDGRVAGLSVLNDGKYSASSSGATMSLTALRSPIYAHHDPLKPETDGDYAFIDQGEQRFAYAMLPHAGDWREAETVRRAAELNRPPVSLPGAFHAGGLPASAAFASCDAPNVVVSVLKRAEDDNALIVRAYETAGRAARAMIRLTAWEAEVAADFGPSEIKTFRVTGAQAKQVGLLEE